MVEGDIKGDGLKRGNFHIRRSHRGLVDGQMV